jgi:hypothetical protein
MKSPLRSRHKTRATALLKEIIPIGSVIDSFLFFSGEIELSLAASNRFVSAHTLNYVIYEFWECALEDPATITEFVISKPFGSFFNKKIFHILQENWPMYKDPYVRSALFFVLNRCSSTAAISSGEFNTSQFTPSAISTLRNFKTNNFHLALDSVDTLSQSIALDTKGEYMLLPMPPFAYNFFKEGKSCGHEEAIIDHQLVKSTLDAIEKKWIVVYPKHAVVLKLYEDYTIRLINKYGNPTEMIDDCEEIIVTNF